MALTSLWFKDNSRLQDAAENRPAMKAPEKGPAVGLVQFALVQLGYPMPISMASGIPDGIFGQETTNTVRDFQKSQGLTADGIAGRNTLARLDKLLADRPPLGSYASDDPQRGRDRPLRKPAGAGPGPLVRKLSAPVPFASPPKPFAGAVPVGGPPTASLPTASGLTVVSGTSSTWVEIGKSTFYSVGVNGSDKDLSNDDVPSGTASPPLLMKPVYRGLVMLPDAALEKTWRTSFESVHGCGLTGTQMIDRFMAGTGLNLTHADGSDISNTARNTDTFKKVHTAVQAEIKKQLRDQFLSGSIDFMKLSLTVDIPFSTATRDLTVPLRFRAMIGGIHGTKLYMRNFKVTPGTVPSVQYDLQYVMGDHFGVGNDDLYTPDLICMNILQHERKGHKPFINWIEVESAALTATLD